MEALGRVECIEQAEQVVLARAATVNEDEGAVGGTDRRPVDEDHGRAGRGSGSGVRRFSSSARICS